MDTFKTYTNGLNLLNLCDIFSFSGQKAIIILFLFIKYCMFDNRLVKAAFFNSCAERPC